MRRATQLPGPPIAEIEALLWHWLTPESFKPCRIYQPEDLTNPHLSTIAKDAIGDSYKIAVAKKVSDIGDGFQRKLQPV